MSVRARALGAGLAVAVAYAAGALVSARLGPLARGPLLDGLAPPTAYRWVDPPPELAATNREPTPGTFGVSLHGGRSETAVFTTEDAQVTLILPEGAFAEADGQRSVELRIEPIDPSSVGQPANPLRFVGNVYLVDATYRPSGDRAELARPATVVLVYPLLADDHGGHSMLASRTGERWRSLETEDLPSIQQAGADVETLGYLAAAGRPATPTVGTGGGDGGSATATIVIVAGLIVLVVVSAFVLLPRRGIGDRADERRR